MAGNPQPSCMDASLNPDALEQLFQAADGDLSFLEEIFDMFFQDAATRIERLESAVPDANWREVRELAHALCGSAGNLGATRCAALCTSLSTAAKRESIAEAEQVARQIAEEVRHLHEIVPTVIREQRGSENRSSSCGS